MENKKSTYRIFFTKTLLLVILSISFTFKVQAQQLLSKSLSETQWIEDIDSLVVSLEKIHPDPYFRYNKAGFYTDVQNVKARLPHLGTDEAFLALLELVTSLQDGHTHISLHQEIFNFSALPIHLFLFEDGLYIIRSKTDDTLKGKKVLKIGLSTTEELFNEFQKLIPADNIYHAKNVFPFQVIISQFLLGLNAINSQEEISISVTDGEQIHDIKMNTVPLHEFFQWAFSPEHDENLPLYRQRPHDIYWQKYLEETGILYMKYNQVISSSEYPISSFIHDLDSLLTAKKPDKLVIDLRDNPGGNKFTMSSLINLLKEHPINQPGKLFLISGRRTNSAATSFITRMKMETNAIQVGEPIGGSPNYYSDVRTITLPNSNIQVAISTQYQRDSFYEDNRRSHYPDLAVSLLAQSYFDNEDSFLDAIKSYKKNEEMTSNISEYESKRIVGRYQYSTNQVLEIQQENEDMIVMINNQFKKKIIRKSNQVYSDVNESIILEFFPDFSKVKVISSGFSKMIKKMPPNELTPIEKIEKGKVREGISDIEVLLSTHKRDELIPEFELNRFGYLYLRQHKIQEAVDLFVLNTKLYPKSANVYDSLGEAYWEMGNFELAAKNYKQSLQLNPDNSNAKDMLEIISEQINK